MRFSKKLAVRSKKVVKGKKKIAKKGKKGQISIFAKTREVISQNEALDLSFSKKLVSRSKKSSKVPIKAKKVEFRT